MRHRWPIAFLSLILIFNPLLAQDDWSKNYAWTIFGEFAFFHRSNIRNKCLVEDRCKDNSQQKTRLSDGTLVCCSDPSVCCPPDFCILTTEDMTKGLGCEPGFRVGANFLFNRNTCDPYYGALKASFLYFDQWEATETRCGDGCFSFPYIDSACFIDFFDADIVTSTYKSKFYDVELNYWGYVTPPRMDYFSYAGIIGFRYLYMREKFDIDFTKRLLFNQCSCSEFNARTENDMFAFQLGCDLQWNPMCTLSWNFTTKLGGIANSAWQKHEISDCDNCISICENECDKWQCGFLVDLEAAMTWLIHPRIFLRASYKFLYLNGVALAPEQVSLLQKPSCIKANGEPMLQGGLVGFGFNF